MESQNLEKIRHSAAHVLAMAVMRLYPETKLGIGIGTEDGFFQDFEFSIPINQNDLSRIEKEMNTIIREKHQFTQMFLPKEIAVNTLLQRGQIYKTELLNESSEEEISFYRTGPDFLDLCRGPHVSNTSEIRAIKLHSLSGAYWKGDENRPQLQRISGYAFRTQEDLNQYIERKEQLDEIDFRKIGRQLNYLIVKNTQVSYSEQGFYILKKIISSIKNHLDQVDYKQIEIPIVREDFNEKIDEIFQLKNRSYRELPMYWYNIGTYIPKNQLEIQGKRISISNIISIITISKEVDYEMKIRRQINLLIRIFKDLNFDIDISIYSPDTENDFIRLISSHLEKNMVSHSQVIDQNRKEVSMIISAKDNFDRKWDFAKTVITYPSETHYTNREGELIPTLNVQTDIILETIIAFLIENKGGMLPFWLSPNKCTIIPISNKFNDYTEQIAKVVEQNNVNCNIDDRSEKMQAKIRDAELKRTPLILIAGEKEVVNQSVSVRIRGSNELGMISLDKIPQLIEKLNNSDDRIFQI